MSKATAGYLTSRAIKRGDLVRQPCEVCGAAPAEAHHDDYSKPLEVRWLCRKHHRAHHGEEQRAATIATIGDQFLGPIRIGPDLHKQLKELAKLNERTVAGEARLALRNHVERNLHSKRAPAEAGQ